MSNKNKATHDGNCQVCGCLQRLPEGRLSTHGYTTRWGFFSGVCTGSHALPFQQSIDLIEGAIARQLAAIGSLTAESTALKDPAKAVGQNKCWHSEYVGAKFRGDSGYKWREIEITIRNVPFIDGGGSYNVVDFVNHEGKTVKLDCYYGSTGSPAEVVLAKNSYYAQVVIDRDIESRKQYVFWQRERIKNWQPSALLERAK